MATDKAQHNSIMEQFSSFAGNFSFDDEQQVKLVSTVVCLVGRLFIFRMCKSIVQNSSVQGLHLVG